MPSKRASPAPSVPTQIDAGVILQHRSGVVAREPLADRLRRRPAVEELIEAVTGADPERALAIFVEGVDRALREPIPRPKALGSPPRMRLNPLLVPTSSAPSRDSAREITRSSAVQSVGGR